ncbi:MAG: phosphatidate cytidylyltransferase [Lachnospiraceae bacterium]|nr:phosphatidate cytidylyltransferase [Lachnospiraceae bacterium]
MAFVDETLHTLGMMLVFLLIVVCVALFCFKVFHITGERRRKLLHTIAFLLILVIIAASEHWYVPSAVCLIFAVVVYPILCHFESRPFYAKLFQERSAGEIRRSLILLFGSAAVLIALFWGVLNSELALVAAILAWGLGDEAAALVGKRFGRHHIEWGPADHHKTWEGSAAMCCTAFFAVFFVLFSGGTALWRSLLTAIVSALTAAVTEAVTKKGYDTVTVPLAAAIVIRLMLAL